jgi:hypothetical protein
LAPRNTKFAQRGAVGSELVGHDCDWSDTLLLQKFPHQLECSFVVSPRLNRGGAKSGGAKIGTAIFAKGWTVEAPVHRQE